MKTSGASRGKSLTAYDREEAAVSSAPALRQSRKKASPVVDSDDLIRAFLNNYVFLRSDSTGINSWLQHLICAGRSIEVSEDCALLHDNGKRCKGDPFCATKRRVCGHVFARDEIAYTCRSCRKDKTCVMCRDCYLGRYVLSGINGSMNGSLF